MDIKKVLRNYSRLGLPISRKAWEWLEMPTLVEAPSAGTPASEIYLLRQLADRVNIKYIHRTQAPPPIHGGQLASASILVDIWRYIIEIYANEEQPQVITRGLEWVGRKHSRFVADQPPKSFVKLFPPDTVLRGAQNSDEYHRRAAEVPSGLDVVVREITLLFFSIANRAFRPFRVLYDDSDLEREAPYLPMMQAMGEYFASQPAFGPVGLTLFECLYAPMRHSPDSLEGQLNYIRRHWAKFLPLDLLERLHLALDILEEEQALRGIGPGPNLALRFDRDAYGIKLGYDEPAAFSRDADWMSNVVLIAKSIYVWLYQLSRKYQRDIRLLSDIPDEELDRLARWGFSGLWLIGLWERSSASQKIKRIMGNPEAMSSAYSLYDYVIAHDLGGEEAFQNLKDRAWRRGIRLASDMVPNHMGIYSKWVIEHPGWFLRVPQPPFPAYQYTGADLSEDGRVCIQIEDGYWQHRDAAVVFKRIDKWTGDAGYIYHGNDGTSMPWNDTAQLNFLIPEVREAVIQTILHVARKFPIIRFDAAMTLAKRHFQRLWFPQPGEGGAIPSRAEHGLTREQFDELMPKEFWREVVDRVAQELPDTLLLAEAFWLMEGYFVRTLGLHRVYNSAFMNMLKMEDNANYRLTIRNVLEFSPEVLKRFVNFMNNPDELTAIEQFGRGDKYYGVAAMMVTMPGLPMFGHGQIEGFAEKYGMEYRQSYWNEQVDEEMVRRQETQIFPLMRRRHLFSGSANFSLYDFNTTEGWVDENVFAYSNRAGDERAIILYNNAYNTTRGHIHTSTAINVGGADHPHLIRRPLAESLGLEVSDNGYYVFRDYQSGLEYIRHSRQLAEQGLSAELRGYQYHAFLDFRIIHDTDGSWGELERRLGGGGTPNMAETHQELHLEPVLRPYRALMNPEMVRGALGDYPHWRDRFEAAVGEFYASVKGFVGSSAKIEPLIKRSMTRLENLVNTQAEAIKNNGQSETAGDDKATEKPIFPAQIYIAFAWLTIDGLGEIGVEGDRESSSVLAVRRADEWLLHKVIRETFEGSGADGDSAYWDSRLVLTMLAHSDLIPDKGKADLRGSFRKILVDGPIREYLRIHSHNDVLWLSKERLERFIETLILVKRLSAVKGRAGADKKMAALEADAGRILDAAEKAGYQVEPMVELLGPKKTVRKVARRKK